MPGRRPCPGREPGEPPGPAATTGPRASPQGGEDPGGHATGLRQRGDGHGARGAGVPGRRVQLDRLHHHAGQDGTDGDGDGSDPGAPAPGTTRAWEALEQAIIGKAVDLLSGPGGLASFLRRRQLGARLGGPSLPLDIGYAETIPAGIRNAVTLRDKHCQWAGRCNQPASACQVHHVRHKANGGKTSARDCVLLCFFHHQIVIHRWGWTLVLNPDGTTTAWNPGKTKVLHSHGPPARPG